MRRKGKAQRPDNLLFGYHDSTGTRHNLTKGKTRKILNRIWTKGDFLGISGHLFRVGGASLCFALKVPIPEIMKLG